MFFGRSRDIAELRRALLGERRFVAVVGSSGCGKSSLVEAGLLPRLLGEQPPAGRPWRDIPLRPQRAPVAQLAAALARLAREEQPDSFGRLHTANARQPVPRHAAADHNRVGRGGPRDPPGPGDPGAGLRGPVRGAVPLREHRIVLCSLVVAASQPMTVAGCRVQASVALRGSGHSPRGSLDAVPIEPRRKRSAGRRPSASF